MHSSDREVREVVTVQLMIHVMNAGSAKRAPTDASAALYVRSTLASATVIATEYATAVPVVSVIAKLLADPAAAVIA